jgi:DNA-binding GntR family transcriptional regulator
MDAPEKLDYTSIGEALLSKIRSEILDGTLPPGQKLQQTEIADRFGISRMPVRDALYRLEGEGLVTFEGGRVATVSALDMDEVVEVYEIRIVLEELAAQKAAKNISDDDLAELSKFEAQMEEASKQHDLGLYLDLDRHFHLKSYEPSGSPRLLALISRYWARTQHYRRAFTSKPGRMEHALEEHREILKRLQERDADGFAAITRQVLQEAMDGILQDHASGVAGLR